MKSEDIDDGLHFPFVNFINTGNAGITAFGIFLVCVYWSKN